MEQERPGPLVFKPGSFGKRNGRGFSLGELATVGLNISQALKMKIPIDVRRRSVHKWNVEILREIATSVHPKREGAGRLELTEPRERIEERVETPKRLGRRGKGRVEGRPKTSRGRSKKGSKGGGEEGGAAQ